jgi:hypothetical protein
MVLKGQFDKDGILKEGAEYYEVDPASGWLQLRADRIPELVPRKERAALSRTHLLAAIPRRDRPEIEYILIQRGKGLPQRVTERPAASTEAARLWDALHARFDGEL